MVIFEDIQKKLMQEIEQAEESIKIAVTWFTNNEIFEVLIQALKKEELEIQLVVLNDRINNRLGGNDFQKFIDLGGKFYFSNMNNLVHHKYCIIDSKKVITGSYNWTYFAETRNWENVTIIDDQAAVKSFEQEFRKITTEHELVLDLKKEIRYLSSIDSSDYLSSEYLIQTEQLVNIGQKIRAGQLIAKVLKEDRNNQKLKKYKSTLLEELNQNGHFKVSPFEIGLKFKKGYEMIIPAFTELPYSTKKVGLTSVDNQTAVKTEVQKWDRLPSTMFPISMKYLRKAPQETEKVLIEFSLDIMGTLRVECKEINGYAYTQVVRNIKEWL